MAKRNIPPDEWITRAFGLSPQRAEWHTLQSIYSGVVVVVLSFCLYMTPSLTGLTQSASRMQVDIYNLQIKFTFGCSLIAIGLSYWNYHAGLQLLEDLKEIDIISGNRMKRRFPIRLVIELAYMTGLCALEVTVSFPSTDAGLAALLFVNMYHGFTSPKVMIDRYTRHINGVASRFSEATNKLQQGEYITEITAHSKLISSASQVSTVFGLEILLVLSIESCLIVYNLYNFRPLLEDFQKDNKNTSIFIFISILWLISWFSDVWHIISTTEEMLNQSKSFNETLLRQIIEDPSAELDKEEKVKLHIAMKKEVIITAFGFFTIDGTFLYNLAAVATTYLVILTQFKGKGPSKTAVDIE